MAVHKAPCIVLAVTASRSAGLLRGQISFLRRSGFRVALICSQGPTAASLASEEGADFVPVPLTRRITPLTDVRSLIAAYRAMRRIQPDLVCAGTPKAAFILLLAAKIAGVKRRIYIVRGLRFESARGVGRIVFAWVERITANVATHVICVSESLRTKMLEDGLLAPGKGVVLGRGSSRGVDLTRFSQDRLMPETVRSVRAELEIPTDGVVVGYVGRLVPAKGIRELLRAWKDIISQCSNPLYLLMVGDVDEDGGGSDPLSSVDGVEPTIKLAGRVDDPVPYYANMDILVLPSHREGFPNVLLEGAAMGLPVVTTSATGCRDAVLEGRSGRIVPVGDSKALADAVLQYVNDPVLRRRHGRAGRRYVEQHFNQEDVWARQREFFLDLITAS